MNGLVSLTARNSVDACLSFSLLVIQIVKNGRYRTDPVVGEGWREKGGVREVAGLNPHQRF